MEENPFWHNFHLDRYIGLLSDGLHDPEQTMTANIKKRAMNVKSKLAKHNSRDIIALRQAPNWNQGQSNTNA